MYVAGIDAHATYSVIAIVSNSVNSHASQCSIKNREANRLEGRIACVRSRLDYLSFGHSRHTVPARIRVRGSRIVGRLAGPSPPTTADRSPRARVRWPGRGTSLDGAVPPDRVA